jgi:hypothetical protein
MTSRFKSIIQKPIYILLTVNILLGLFIFRDYGLSWDEPLFYNYADALGYAYSPKEWFSGHFDLTNSYGISGDDHKTRGPAFLFLAREPVYLLEAFGLDSASAWHLVNFLFFQFGVYFLYRFSTRWMKRDAALATSTFFSWQPLLWGHAFINPKDPPFLVFFLGSVCLGFEMVDSIAQAAVSTRSVPRSGTGGDRKKLNQHIILAAFILGITTSIRVLGPLAGFLVFAYFIIRILQGKNLRVSLSPWIMFFAYGFIAILSMLFTWPYLWENPVSRFLDVLKLMSDNPTTLSVLFGGEVYRAGELPGRYLPFMLATTLTEPIWPLFAFGVAFGYLKLLKQNIKAVIDSTEVSAVEAQAEDTPQGLKHSKVEQVQVLPFQNLAITKVQIGSLTLVLIWFIILLAYVLIRRPSMYDGLRHFLFMLPPIFIFAGFTFEYLFRIISPAWLRAGLVLVLVTPGLIGIYKLHPYEYSYYNSFVGGTSHAFRNYETDYWLTCYKESVEQLDENHKEPFDLYVHREAYIAEYYAEPDTRVHGLRGAVSEVKSGDYVLVNTRTNEDRRVFKDAPTILQIGRGDAVFCIIKEIP